MSASMNTILIIGGTSGIGESFARRFHGMGKKIIITGRREEKLKELQKPLPGLETYAFDMADLTSLSSHVEKLFTTYKDIDTVWVNGGIQVASDIKDVSSSTDGRVMNEITTNITAPIIITRHVVPRLIAQKRETQIMITSSGLGFLPLGSLFPVYCATKAAVHQYMVDLRQALKDTNVNVLELVPPYIITALVDEHKEKLSKVPALPLDEFTDSIFKTLETNQAKDLKEIAAGTAIPRVDVWRNSVGEMLAKNGLGG